MIDLNATQEPPRPTEESDCMPSRVASLKPSSARVYDKAIQHYRTVFKGDVPCDREMFDRYVASMRKSSPSTVYLRVQALRHEHVRLGLPSPTDAPDVRTLLRQLQKGVVPAKVDRTGRVRAPARHREPRQARPLTRALLTRMLDAMGTNPLDRRDRCLLLVGFSAALSALALTSLNVEDVTFTNDAMLLSVGSVLEADSVASGARRVFAIPRTGHELCAARATAEWIAHAQLEEEGGPLIRRFDRASNPTSERLEAAYVSAIVKRRLAAVGIDPKAFSSLSLPRGRRAEVAKGLL